MRRYWGKYRGTVVENNDPLHIGRIQAAVPAVSETPLGWALPCVPYAGAGKGFYMIPPVSAKVWIEFEEGDLSRPIWSGCFWTPQTGLGAPAEATSSSKKVWKTDEITLILDDAGNQITARLEGRRGPVTLVLDQDGLALNGKRVAAAVEEETR
jgi:uncharacterized protein involved in type VI secretion and phage assembly